jgi:hypothetical protein
MGSVVLVVIVLAGWGLKALLARPKSPQETMEEFARQAARGTPSNSTPLNKEATSTPIASPPFTIKGDAMAQAFRSGKLPSPLPQPTGNPEQAAAELAKRVMAEDEQSTAALLTAVRMSGFSVRADEGALAYESVKPGQGIVIDAWEVAALAKLFGDGMQIKLSDLSDAFASTFPPLKNAPVAKLFVDGLRGAAQGNQPAMRFWADFIAELGRQSRQHYDLLAPYVDTAKVDLDAIQVSLILRRLAADLMIQERSKNQKGQWAPVPKRDWTSARWERAPYDVEGGTQPYIRDAVWHPERGPRLVLVQEGGASNLPCTISELGSQIMDSSAYVSGKAFDALLEYLAEHAEMEGAGKYGNATSKANAVLALIKLIAYYACMETDITMSESPPLERTKSIYKNGERRTLTGTVRENIKNWQAVNCTRIALNGANLDISLPNDGPVAGVKTQWLLKSGGMSVSGNQITYPIVELVFPDGTPLIQNAMVPISDASSPKTSKEGQTTIDIEGIKQREELRNPVPVMKQAEVNFSVAAKAVSMRQDIIDALGNGASFSKSSGFIAGPLTIGVGGLVETLLRSNIHLSKTLTIPVKDWVSCDGGWGGTISYTTTSQTATTGGDRFSPWSNSREETTVNEITLRGEPGVATGWNGSSHGSFSASYDLEDTNVIVNPPVKSFGGAVITVQDKQTAVGDGETTVDIHAHGDGTYDIQVKGGNMPGKDHWQTRCTGDCPKSTATTDKDSSIVATILGMSATTAKEDPNQPGVLSGGATLENTPSTGATTKITWSLDQCQGGK